MSAPPLRIGVDTGGTFTDLLCLHDGKLRVFKLRSHPADPSQAILAGIRALTNSEAIGAGTEVTHGSTVATNAVLERKGARVALVTTAGFEDVLRIGRQTRPELYNFLVRRPEPLVPAERSFGVSERLAADGEVLEPLRPEEVQALLPVLQQAGVESVAVCFLHSYAFPAHEHAVAAQLRAHGFRVSASHDVLPEHREFERWSTTAVNAYVSPLMAKYLERLQTGLQGSRLRIMQSNGGSISAGRAGTEAVQTILSGPAAGVIGAQSIAAASGCTRLITLDMGGTSTDVSLINEVIGTTQDTLVGDLPVRLPVLDIHTVGAGGGSIAWVDAGGSLRVGPRSAGAQPGPVCFGVGDELTVTDAHLLLGRLDPSFFLGGRMALDMERTRAVAAKLAEALEMSVEALAEGIVRIANANMERAVRVVSVQRGFDPRDFALVAFGGAGGLHACELAAALEMRTVLIPEHSGVLSALGMLLADVVRESSVSVLQPLSALSRERFAERLRPMLERARHELMAEGFEAGDLTMQAAAAIRYKGQAFELDVPLPMSTDGALTGELGVIAESFHEKHARTYGYRDDRRPIEVVQLRLRATGVTQKPALPMLHGVEAKVAPEPDLLRSTVFDGEARSTPFFHRGRLKPGHQGTGPAVIVTGEATNVAPPGWTWRVDGAGTLVLENVEVSRAD